MVDRFRKFRILAKFWELFGFLAHMEPQKIWVYFFRAEKPIFHYINHPYKRPNFKVCAATLIIELESCRRRFEMYSGAFRIGAKKSRFFFLRLVWPPLVVIKLVVDSSNQTSLLQTVTINCISLSQTSNKALWTRPGFSCLKTNTTPFRHEIPRLSNNINFTRLKAF